MRKGELKRDRAREYRSLYCDREAEQEAQMLGPNVRKLIAHKMSLDAVPIGGKEPVAKGVEFLLDKDRIQASARSSSEWAKAALEAIRGAADPNPWRLSTDEEIAAFLLEEIKKRNDRQNLP